VSTTYSREIERKFVVEGLYGDNLEAVCDFLAGAFDRPPFEEATSVDRFWRPPNVDFLRLRDDRDLTIKVTDRSSIVNRIEENVKVDNVAVAEKMFTLIYGEPKKLTKTYKVWRLFSYKTKFEKPLYVSAYSVEGDNRVFVEVESEEADQVDSTSILLVNIMELRVETRSLYQIFFSEER